MSHEQSEPKSKRPADWNALVFLAIAAPVAAALIHSTFVFRSGIRFYNAELWVFSGQHSLSDILTWIANLSIEAFLTFFVLLPFRRLGLYRWPAWVSCIAVWTFLFFKLEVAVSGYALTSVLEVTAG
jgi:hypothetical protein